MRHGAEKGSAGRNCFGAVAQLGEHLLCKQGVSGSIPLSSTKRIGLARCASPRKRILPKAKARAACLGMGRPPSFAEEKSFAEPVGSACSTDIVKRRFVRIGIHLGAFAGRDAQSRS